MVQNNLNALSYLIAFSSDAQIPLSNPKTLTSIFQEDLITFNSSKSMKHETGNQCLYEQHVQKRMLFIQILHVGPFEKESHRYTGT